MTATEKQVPALSTIDFVRRPALALLVEERLRDAIMFGELALGELISEDRLATRLGVSRTPVREALTALQMQGLVVIQAQRGSYVFSPTEREIAEVCDFRFWVEDRALALAHLQSKTDTIKALEKAQAAMATAERAHSAIDAARADAAFHQAFIDRCGNKLLMQAYSLVSGRVGAIRFFARKSGGARSHAGAEHREIIAALTNDRVNLASKILKKHIMNMHAHFMDALQAR